MKARKYTVVLKSNATGVISNVEVAVDPGRAPLEAAVMAANGYQSSIEAFYPVDQPPVGVTSPPKLIARPFPFEPENAAAKKFRIEQVKNHLVIGMAVRVENGQTETNVPGTIKAIDLDGFAVKCASGVIWSKWDNATVILDRLGPILLDSEHLYAAAY